MQKEWEERFRKVIARDSFEQFSMMMCDPKHALDKQRQLLHAILFQDHKAIRNWEAYLDFLASSPRYLSQKDNLIRLGNRALCLIADTNSYNTPEYIRIYLRVAEWMSRFVSLRQHLSL
jgi:hypothetical protein